MLSDSLTKKHGHLTNHREDDDSYSVNLLFSEMIYKGCLQ